MGYQQGGRMGRTLFSTGFDSCIEGKYQPRSQMHTGTAFEGLYHGRGYSVAGQQVSSRDASLSFGHSVDTQGLATRKVARPTMKVHRCDLSVVRVPAPAHHGRY